MMVCILYRAYDRRDIRQLNSDVLDGSRDGVTDMRLVRQHVDGDGYLPVLLCVLIPKLHQLAIKGLDTIVKFVVSLLLWRHVGLES